MRTTPTSRAFPACMPQMTDVDVSQIIGYEGEPVLVEYNARDLLVYAAGVGETDLMYAYELHPGTQPQDPHGPR